MGKGTGGMGAAEGECQSFTRGWRVLAEVEAGWAEGRGDCFHAVRSANPTTGSPAREQRIHAQALRFRKYQDSPIDEVRRCATSRDHHSKVVPPSRRMP